MRGDGRKGYRVPHSATPEVQGDHMNTRMIAILALVLVVIVIVLLVR